MVWICPNCRKTWHYALGKCVYCKADLSQQDPGNLAVTGFTEVRVPSAEHPDVPYFVLLLEDEHGNRSLRKSFTAQKIGDILSSDSRPAVRRTFGVAGTGSMATGVAFSALSAGFDVVVRGRSKESLDKFRNGIAALAEKAMAGRKDELLSRLTLSTDHSSLARCEIVVENVIENLQAKRDLFAELDAACPPSVVLASNTSSLLVSRLADGLAHPERVLGMHFFNPVHRMRLVEVIPTPKTSESAVELACAVAAEIGKEPIVVRDSPGFIVNRILFPMLNEAVLLLESGKASAEDIDRAAMLGLNHPMGPLHLVDLIGVDVFVEIMDNLKEETGDARFAAAGLARRMAKDGLLGRKAKQGFFKY
ncbi:MAG: 3-hydroxyacyl-CoA dehydrogenase family protein [Candidatus Micrarchaeota archaeon]